jgi:filamentous hemagglutinin
MAERARVLANLAESRAARESSNFSELANTEARLAADAAARAAAPTTEAARSGVWRLDPFRRGQVIEENIGRNVPSNFPVIDRFQDGVVTSIKSIDLNAASYQNNSTLNRVLRGYIDKVAEFRGMTWADFEVAPGAITGRALDLAVPHGGSTAQRNIINQVVQYGASRGVNVNIIVIP